MIKAANPMVAGLIVGKRQFAVSEQQRRAIAQERLKQQRAAEAVQLWVKGTRRRADIKYQPGFAPGAAKKNAPAAQKQAG